MREPATGRVLRDTCWRGLPRRRAPIPYEVPPSGHWPVARMLPVGCGVIVERAGCRRKERAGAVESKAAVFRAHRGRLFAVAYRMLGTTAVPVDVDNRVAGRLLRCGRVGGGPLG